MKPETFIHLIKKITDVRTSQGEIEGCLELMCEDLADVEALVFLAANNTEDVMECVYRNVWGLGVDADEESLTNDD